MEPTATQTTAPEQVLERVWQGAFSTLGPLPEAFIIDRSLPSQVVRQAAELGLTLEEVGAVLACWRANMLKSIDEVVHCHMIIAKNSLR